LKVWGELGGRVILRGELSASVPLEAVLCAVARRRMADRRIARDSCLFVIVYILNMFGNVRLF
jgi:hypothetical protein